MGPLFKDADAGPGSRKGVPKDKTRLKLHPRLLAPPPGSREGSFIESGRQGIAFCGPEVCRGTTRRCLWTPSGRVWRGTRVRSRTL